MGAAAAPLRTMEAPQHPRPPRRVRARRLFEPELVRQAIRQAFVMLRPDIQWANPVMFVVEIGAILTALFIAQALLSTSASQVPDQLFYRAGRVVIPDRPVREFCHRARGGPR